MFPEEVHYECESDPGRKIEDWETANALLSYLDPKRNPFVIFSLPDGSYVQCLGAKRALAVEARIVTSASGKWFWKRDRGYRHWVFGKGQLKNIDVTVGLLPIVTTVDESQVLALRDARLIMRTFLETRMLHENYLPFEITDRF